jgi:acyl-CoA reductase-like NAD-dependent aldehyde dehydrogenase
MGSVNRRIGEAGSTWAWAVPFGGVKSSGYGLEHGVEGLKAVAAPRVVNHPPKGGSLIAQSDFADSSMRRSR